VELRPIMLRSAGLSSAGATMKGPTGGGDHDKRRRRDQSPLDDKRRVAYYRAQAAECLRLAETMADPVSRQQWIDIANGWAHLASHAERQSRP
jgi:hypothetical protein